MKNREKQIRKFQKVQEKLNGKEVVFEKVGDSLYKIWSKNNYIDWYFIKDKETLKTLNGKETEIIKTIKIRKLDKYDIDILETFNFDFNQLIKEYKNLSDNKIQGFFHKKVSKLLALILGVIGFIAGWFINSLIDLMNNYESLQEFIKSAINWIRP